MNKSKVEVEQLRELRASARTLGESAIDDLLAFVHSKDRQTFVRLPTSEHKKNDVGVTVTCSCLMSLALVRGFDAFAEKRKPKKWDPIKAFKLVLETSRWKSSGLVNMNAFTSTIVLRTFGMLVERGKMRRKEAKTLIHRGPKEERRGLNGEFGVFPFGTKMSWTVEDVLKDLGMKSLDRLRVENYPVSAAILYWYLDAIDRSGFVRLCREKFWTETATWAAREFWKQVSLITAQNDVLMDPVALAMSACVCRKLKSFADELKKKRKHSGRYFSQLPSESELEFGLKLVFGLQAHSGVWSKYFPLFHYPDAGNNFCFTFEMLEAVLNEFGKGDIRILEIDGAFDALSKAVQWCKENRFEYRHGGRLYKGWNSGGQPESINLGKPESWATAVVHMFLWEVEDVLSRGIQQKLLAIYKATKYRRAENALDDFLDIEILIRRKPKSLISLLNTNIISPAIDDEGSLQSKGLSGKVSALLFGPPGTSKTELCKAIATRLGWPLVELDPSHFLKGGPEAISVHADKIFSDLMDLNGVVILFDEMDALVQTRDVEDWHLDTATQLLTTSMLPKLAKLHEHRRAIFFMATNFQNRFDPAIKRAGRFDLLLCMGPPTLESKLVHVSKFADKSTPAIDIELIRKRIRSYTNRDDETSQMLGLFTFGETKALFRSLSAGKPLLDKLKGLGPLGFKDRLEQEEEFKTLRIKDLKNLPRELIGKTLGELAKDERVNFDFLKDQLKFPIIRYLADRRQSKIQV